jgi:hypothetical protein
MPTRDADGTRAGSPGGNGPSAGGQAPGKTAGEIQSKANETGSHAVAADLVSPAERHARISLAAYQRAEARGFASGSALEDWLSAEREVDSESDG